MAVAALYQGAEKHAATCQTCKTKRPSDILMRIMIHNADEVVTRNAAEAISPRETPPVPENSDGAKPGGSEEKPGSSSGSPPNSVWPVAHNTAESITVVADKRKDMTPDQIESETSNAQEDDKDGNGGKDETCNSTDCKDDMFYKWKAKDNGTSIKILDVSMRDFRQIVEYIRMRPGNACNPTPARSSIRYKTSVKITALSLPAYKLMSIDPSENAAEDHKIVAKARQGSGEQDLAFDQLSQISNELLRFGRLCRLAGRLRFDSESKCPAQRSPASSRRDARRHPLLGCGGVSASGDGTNGVCSQQTASQVRSAKVPTDSRLTGTSTQLTSSWPSTINEPMSGSSAPARTHNRMTRRRLPRGTRMGISRVWSTAPTVPRTSSAMV